MVRTLPQPWGPGGVCQSRSECCAACLRLPMEAMAAGSRWSYEGKHLMPAASGLKAIRSATFRARAGGTLWNGPVREPSSSAEESWTLDSTSLFGQMLFSATNSPSLWVTVAPLVGGRPCEQGPRRHSLLEDSTRALSWWLQSGS